MINQRFDRYFTVPLMSAFALGVGVTMVMALVLGPVLGSDTAVKLADAQQASQAALARATNAEADRDEFRRQLVAAVSARDSALNEANLLKQQKLAVEEERDNAQRLISGIQPSSGKDTAQDQIIAYLFAHDSGSTVYVSSIASATGMQAGLVNYYLQELMAKQYISGDKNGVTIAEAGRAYWVKRNGME